jgi:hypothetical protein
VPGKRDGFDIIEAMSGRKPYPELIASGLASGCLYLLLYLYRDEILATWTRTDGWYPALPIVTVFVFSMAHGAFTAYFWDVLGVRAKR